VEAADLSQLPAALEDLSIDSSQAGASALISTNILQELQHLTRLELIGVSLETPGLENPSIEPLRHLTKLVHL
jgi:hypothetical protein